MTQESARRQSWLTLGAASELLGVSESTIRRWADSGEIRSFRTRGGHRRILEEDLHLMLTGQASPRGQDTGRINDIALALVRRRLTGERQGAHNAFEGLDSEVVGRLRLLGRQLVDVFAHSISDTNNIAAYVDDARLIGREYGRTLVGAGVGLSTAIGTFNHLRRPLEETASQIATEAGLPTEDAVLAIENSLDLADIVLEGMAQVYEQSLPRD